MRYELSKNKEDEITRGIFVDFGLNKKLRSVDGSESLKKQCAMTSFSCHILLDQSATIFQNSFFSLCELSMNFVNCS